MSDVPTPEEIINGGKKKTAAPLVIVDVATGMGMALAPEQEHAIKCICSGMAFVFIGLKPTENGGDFFHAIHGKDKELHDAKPYLQRQIDRMYHKREII